MDPKTSSWRRFYDAVAFAYDFVLAWADRWGLGAEGRVRREYIAALPLAAGVRVLDLGCGTAANRPFLPADATYIGVDVSGGMLRRAQAKGRRQGWQLDLVQADVNALPFRAGCMQTLVAVGVLQHVADPRRAIDECRRVAAPGASLLAADERHAWKRANTALDPASPTWVGDYFVVRAIL